MTRTVLYVCFAMLVLSFSTQNAFSILSLKPTTEVEDVNENYPEQEKLDIDFSQPLSLRECIDIALKNSTNVKNANLDLTVQEMNVKDALTGYYPMINTSGSYRVTDDVDFGWERENYDALVYANFTIWNHGQREASLAQARARRDAEFSTYNRTEQSLVYSVISTYYDFLETEKMISVDQQLLDLSNQNVDKIKALVEVGSAIEADIATARVQQASDELTVVNDLNNLELAGADLAVLMGIEPDVSINLLDDPDYEIYMDTGIIEMDEITLEEAKATALENRPEIDVQQANIDVLETALDLAQLELWPKLTADCGYNVFLDDYLRERDALKNHRNWNVSARATYPVFDGGRSKRTVRRAEIAMAKAQETMAELKRNIELEVYQAYLSLQRAKKAMDISNVQVDDAEESLKVAQGRYEQQMIILLELLDIQTRYASALTNQVRAFYDYKVAAKTLERAMGVLK
ncbi:hypothetical protein GF312_21740 [Candidatus Poribacteria bacterium]|nr:hypothetical protein [Candidatus Poribacteria bacterium]